MAIINKSNGNYIKIGNIQVMSIDNCFKVILTFYLYKSKDQRLIGPAEFETYYEKQLESSEFIFVNDLDTPINNLKTGAYYTLRRAGYDTENWIDA